MLVVLGTSFFNWKDFETLMRFWSSTEIDSNWKLLLDILDVSISLLNICGVLCMQEDFWLMPCGLINGGADIFKKLYQEKILKSLCDTCNLMSNGLDHNGCKMTDSLLFPKFDTILLKTLYCVTNVIKPSVLMNSYFWAKQGTNLVCKCRKNLTNLE